MHWRSSQILAQKLARLNEDRNAATRGAGLELLVADLFGHEHFRVERENLSSNGRQVDLFLTRGQLRLLVETKWTKRKATIEEVDQLLTRLEGAPPNVVGLLVSMSGFSRTAVERVEAHARRPILLLSGDEVAEMVTRGQGLHALVRWKLDRLITNHKVEFGPALASAPLWLSELPEAGIQIFDLDGDELSYWESDGGFHSTIHSMSLNTIDLALGAVSVDFDVAVDDADDLVDLLRRLAQSGWMTNDGSWRIEQSAVSWNGFASAELARQLLGPQDRYRGSRMHHSEKVLYLDHFEEGLFTISADVTASAERWVRGCSLSFLLTGIPLDTSPFEALAIDLPVLNNPVFRTVAGAASSSGRIHRRGTPTPRSALAYLTRHTTMFGDQPPDAPTWVEGVIVRDPLHRATRARRTSIGLPPESLGSTLCWLRQHHHAADQVQYEALHVSSVQTSGAQVVRVTTDWLNPDDEGAAVRRPSRSPRARRADPDI
jgi:hypothetical protein